MRVKWLIGSCFLMLITFAHLSFGQTLVLQSGTRVLKGQVAQVHWVSSTLVVRWLDGSRFDEMTFTVENGAKIYKNGKSVSLSNLNHGDQVTVEYYDDGFEGLKATKISIVGGL